MGQHGRAPASERGHLQAMGGVGPKTGRGGAQGGEGFNTPGALSWSRPGVKWHQVCACYDAMHCKTNFALHVPISSWAEVALSV